MAKRERLTRNIAQVAAEGWFDVRGVRRKPTWETTSQLRPAALSARALSQRPPPPSPRRQARSGSSARSLAASGGRPSRPFAVREEREVQHRVPRFPRPLLQLTSLIFTGSPPGREQNTCLLGTLSIPGPCTESCAPREPLAQITGRSGWPVPRAVEADLQESPHGDISPSSGIGVDALAAALGLDTDAMCRASRLEDVHLTISSSSVDISIWLGPIYVRSCSQSRPPFARMHPCNYYRSAADTTRATMDGLRRHLCSPLPRFLRSRIGQLPKLYPPPLMQYQQNIHLTWTLSAI
ncbi:hypothetical protein OH77DRAFT_564877 [Trametes cingulata]|nr:hypothetical protein OH77DRAFT_564877 [Trametes cingulata]